MKKWIVLISVAAFSGGAFAMSKVNTQAAPCCPHQATEATKTACCTADGSCREDGKKCQSEAKCASVGKACAGDKQECPAKKAAEKPSGCAGGACPIKK